MKLDNLKARIRQADYEVDADAVAEAIVRRLLTARPSAPRVVERQARPGLAG